MSAQSNEEIFNARLEEGHLLHLHHLNKVFGHDHVFVGCEFNGLNKNKDHFFSLTSIPGESGFHARMQGVKIIPTHYASFCNMPKWLFVTLKFFGLKEVDKQ